MQQLFKGEQALFELPVDDGIGLRILHPDDTGELFALLERNRARLRPWIGPTLCSGGDPSETAAVQPRSGGAVGAVVGLRDAMGPQPPHQRLRHLELVEMAGAYVHSKSHRHHLRRGRDRAWHAAAGQAESVSRQPDSRSTLGSNRPSSAQK